LSWYVCHDVFVLILFYELVAFLILCFMYVKCLFAFSIKAGRGPVV
jgi:hypothetical protein